MEAQNHPPATIPARPIYIVSGGVGASGEQLVHTVLAQFPDQQVPVITVGNVRTMEQLDEVVIKAGQEGGLIVHTLVDESLRIGLIERVHDRHVQAIDLFGPLMSWLAGSLGCEPLGLPGLYRKLHQAYFERVEAIEYSMAHDDGKQPQGWPAAEILLIGVSRVGKTPLSLYLSVLGWKVANLPYIRGLVLPRALDQVDRQRVIGLTIEPGQLLVHRQQRQSRLGAPGLTPYTDPATIFAEVEEALQYFESKGFTVIDVTDKPIETSADEIIKRVNRRFRRAGDPPAEPV